MSIFWLLKWGKLWQGHTPHFMVWSRPKCKDCHSELGRDELQSGPLALPWTSEAASHFRCSSIFHDCQVTRQLRSCVSPTAWTSFFSWPSSGRWSVCTSLTKTSLDRHNRCSYFWPLSQEGQGGPCCCLGAHRALILSSSSGSSSSALRGYSEIESCLFWASSLDEHVTEAWPSGIAVKND